MFKTHTCVFGGKKLCRYRNAKKGRKKKTLNDHVDYAHEQTGVHYRRRWDYERSSEDI